MSAKRPAAESDAAGARPFRQEKVAQENDWGEGPSPCQGILLSSLNPAL
jgi:hypothetical protein